MVVVTASDRNQEIAYDTLLKSKVQKKLLPLGVKYEVISDPPGTRIGSGGSALYVLDKLTHKYGADLENWRVILVSAGGQSQRLMSGSALGKISLALPIGDPMYDQLDVILANFLPLLPRMKPGVFHAAADVIITYDLEGVDNWDFRRSGFTALAHPSSLAIGTGHGVYVLKEQPKEKAGMTECLRVLQKPSVELMGQKGAISKEDDEEYVYTDSVFFFGFDVVEKLVAFYNQHGGPFPCELCCYGDFLQGLGVDGSGDYCCDVKNVAKQEPGLIQIRKKLYECLKDTDLNILCMNASKFYHLGTTAEYLLHLCEHQEFANELGTNKHINVEYMNNNSQIAKRIKTSSSLKGCVFRSKLHRASCSDSRSIIEYSDFDVPLTVGRNAILSSCRCVNVDDVKEVEVPAGVFVHTIAVKKERGVEMEEERVGYVTVVCHVDDDMKKKVAPGDVGKVVFLGRPMEEYLKKAKLKCEEVVNSTDGNVTLWNLKLFPVCDSMEQSFLSSLAIVDLLLKDNELSKQTYHNARLMSVADVMASKDVVAMLQYRNSFA